MNAILYIYKKKHNNNNYNSKCNFFILDLNRILISFTILKVQQKSVKNKN